MSDFKDTMKTLGQSLSPEAKEIVKIVLVDGHKNEFSDNREELVEKFAHKALSLAKPGRAAE